MKLFRSTCDHCTSTSQTQSTDGQTDGQTTHCGITALYTRQQITIIMHFYSPKMAGCNQKKGLNGNPFGGSKLVIFLTVSGPRFIWTSGLRTKVQKSRAVLYMGYVPRAWLGWMGLGHELRICFGLD